MLGLNRARAQGARLESGLQEGQIFLLQAPTVSEQPSNWCLRKLGGFSSMGYFCKLRRLDASR